MAPAFPPDQAAPPARPWPIPWLPAAQARLLLPATIVLAGGLLAADTLQGSLLPGFTVAAMAGGWWLLSRSRTRPRPALPQTLEAWFQRCDQLLLQFDQLQGAAAAGLARAERLERLRRRRGRHQLELAVVGVNLPAPAVQPVLLEALRGPLPLALHWAHPLPAASPSWRWAEPFAEADQLLYCLGNGLGGADLRWLDSLPEGQPVWLLVPCGSLDQAARAQLELELRAQLPQHFAERLLFWPGGSAQLPASLEPMRQQLQAGGRQLLLATDRRCLETLHADWQKELELLRRERLRPLLQRTQWLVAAAVVVTPLPSLDLLVLAVANGLMLQEMARLWGCSWSADQLREAAIELAKAALALGVAEWSSQTLLTLMRLEAGSWLVGSALQALSAAYLTRVVALAMADGLALSSGVVEADLAELRRQAPLLVSRAAVAAQLDWPGFLGQAKDWLRQGGPAGVAAVPSVGLPS